MPFFTGLDLGQLADFTALVVMEQTIGPEKVCDYAIRHLKRWKIGTPYPQIVNDVINLFRRPPLTKSTLCIDATGVGRPVVDLFRQSFIEATLIPITIVTGFNPNFVRGEWHVPKKDLVGVLQVLLGSRRLQIAGGLEQANILVREFGTFKVKQNPKTGTESFEAWRERDHDDLVLATALPLWYAERALRLPNLRIYSTAPRKDKDKMRLVIHNRLGGKPLIMDEKHLLISIGEKGRECDLPVNENRLRLLWLSFADIEAEKYQDKWDQPCSELNGAIPSKVIFTKEMGKRLWSFILKPAISHEPAAVIVVEDDGDRRAYSVAKAIADRLDMWQPETEKKELNQFVYQTVKEARSLVI